MSEDDPNGYEVSVLTLQGLICAGMRERRWSYTDLEGASGRALTRGRWQQLGSGVAQRRFPDPASLMVIARVLQLDITTVVFAAAQTLGLDVSSLGSATCPVCGPRAPVTSLPPPRYASTS